MLMTNRKRRLGVLLAALVLLLALPAAAWANSAHNPYWKYIVLSDTTDVAAIDVYVDGPDGGFHLLQTFESEHRKDQRISFKRPEDAARLYVEVTMEDGTVRASEPIDCAGYDQDFTYNVKKNTLKEKRSYFGLYLLFLPVILLAPFVFTILVEFLVALPFKLKPYKYVIVINAITNPLLNLTVPMVQMILSLKGDSAQWIILGLELVVVLAEYLFYTKKYPDRKKSTLYWYTLLANALSWGLYEIVQHLGLV